MSRRRPCCPSAPDGGVVEKSHIRFSSPPIRKPSHTRTQNPCCPTSALPLSAGAAPSDHLQGRTGRTLRRMLFWEKAAADLEEFDEERGATAVVEMRWWETDVERRLHLTEAPFREMRCRMDPITTTTNSSTTTAAEQSRETMPAVVIGGDGCGIPHSGGSECAAYPSGGDARASHSHAGGAHQSNYGDDCATGSQGGMAELEAALEAELDLMGRRWAAEPRDAATSSSSWGDEDAADLKWRRDDDQAYYSGAGVSPAELAARLYEVAEERRREEVTALKAAVQGAEVAALLKAKEAECWKHFAHHLLRYHQHHHHHHRHRHRHRHQERNCTRCRHGTLGVQQSFASSVKGEDNDLYAFQRQESFTTMSSAFQTPSV